MYTIQSKDPSITNSSSEMIHSAGKTGGPLAEVECRRMGVKLVRSDTYSTELVERLLFLSRKTNIKIVK